MTQAKFKRLFSGASGICNTRDPSRLDFDPRTGISQLAEGVNVDLDASGRPSRNTGYTEKRTDASHSAWSNGETDCFYVSGTTLYRLHPDYSRTAIRTDLTTGLRMSYANVAGRVYYMNGAEKGYVRGVADFAWEKGVSGAPDSNVTYSDPPLGHIITWAFGRMLVGIENVTLGSEPSFYGRFNLAKFRGEGERITMLRRVEGGLFVGTTKKVVFYQGEQWEQVRRVVKANYGVLEGSDALCRQDVVGLEGSDNPFIIFATDQGVCLGGDGGFFRNITSDNLKLPTARKATGAVVGRRYIVHIAP